jgi:hypothetical protein
MRLDVKLASLDALDAIKLNKHAFVLATMALKPKESVAPR